MSSSPGLGKECLPPKKRESRQGSAEQGPTDTFKRPAPLWERTTGRRAEQRAEPGEETMLNSCCGVDVPPPMTPPMTPPLPSASPQTQPLPAPTPMYSMPWHIPYPAAPFIPSPGGEPSLVWRGHGSGGGDPLELSWSRPLTLPHGGVPVPYRTPFPPDLGDMFTCLPSRLRNYSSPQAQIAHASLLSRPLSYCRDPLFGDKTGLPTKRHNGFDRRERWYAHAGKPLERQGDGHGENHENPQEGKRICHANRQSSEQTYTEDAKNAPLAHSKDLWVVPRAPSDKLTDTKATVADFPAPPWPPGHVQYTLPPPSCAVSQQRPLEHPHRTPPTHKNSQLSRPAEKRREDVPKSQSDGPHGNRPHQDPQRLSSPSPRALGLKAKSGNPLEAPNTSSTTARPPIVLPYFQRGSLIELGGGRLKRVEELRTEDFLLCPDPGPNIHLSSCTILMISPSPDPAFSRLQVLLPDHNTQELLEVLVEYPFFVRDRGWSSCCPRRTVQLYELRCHQLRVGDVCLALTPLPSSTCPPSPARQALVVPAWRARSRGGGPGSGPRTAVRGTATEEKQTPPSPIPAPPRGSPQKRKRRWSAPELQGMSGTLAESPDSPKQRRQH